MLHCIDIFQVYSYGFLYYWKINCTLPSVDNVFSYRGLNYKIKIKFFSEVKAKLKFSKYPCPFYRISL